MKNLATGFILTFCALLLCAHVLMGVKLDVVMSNSMKPSLSSGDMIVTHLAKTKALEVGDVPIIALGENKTLTAHRVTEVRHTNAGSYVTTKGDANILQDDPVFIAQEKTPVTLFAIPLLGHFFNFINPHAITALIIVSALTFVGASFFKHVRNQNKPALATSKSTYRYSREIRRIRVLKRNPSILKFVAVSLTALTLAGSGVWASLQAAATNTTPQQVSTGTLSMVLGSAALTTPVNNILPGDSRYQIVTLNSNGTLNSRNLRLEITPSNSTALTTDATRGLTIRGDRCSITWRADGTCAGTTTTPIPVTPLSNYANPTMISGSFPAGTILNLKLTISLPEQTEATVDGVKPSNTIQNLSTVITWNFVSDQLPPSVSTP